MKQINQKKVKEFWDYCDDFKIAFADSIEVTEYTHTAERNHLFKIIQVDSNINVLDIGGGPGRWTIEFAKRCAKVVAVDYSKKMLKCLDTSLASQDLRNVELILTSAQNFRYPEKFDIMIVGTENIRNFFSQISF